MDGRHFPDIRTANQDFPLSRTAQGRLSPDQQLRAHAPSAGSVSGHTHQPTRTRVFPGPRRDDRRIQFLPNTRGSHSP